VRPVFVDEHNCFQIADIGHVEPVTSGGPLKRGESQRTSPVPAEGEIDEAVTQPADAVKKDDRVMFQVAGRDRATGNFEFAGCGRVDLGSTYRDCRSRLGFRHVSFPDTLQTMLTSS